MKYFSPKNIKTFTACKRSASPANIFLIMHSLMDLFTNNKNQNRKGIIQ